MVKKTNKRFKIKIVFGHHPWKSSDITVIQRSADKFYKDTANKVDILLSGRDHDKQHVWKYKFNYRDWMSNKTY